MGKKEEYGLCWLSNVLPMLLRLRGHILLYVNDFLW